MINSFLVFTFLLGSVTQACIWKNSESPYWDSNTIPVCFIKPKGLFSFEMKRARYTIKRAFHTQFNLRTPFKFKGFKFCKNENDQNKRKSKIRIALTYGMGGGTSSGVGPETAQDSPNLSIDYIGIDSSTQQPIFSATTTANAALHETMHLLGVLHDMDRHNKRRLASIQHHNPVLVGEYDPDSVLVKPNTTVLSAGDVRCLERIANREMASIAKSKKDESLTGVSVDLGDVQVKGQPNSSIHTKKDKNIKSSSNFKK